MPLESESNSLFAWSDASGTFRQLDVDVVMSSDDTREAKKTEHTVEDGSIITDHLVVLPEKVSFKLIVTQTPIVESEDFAPTQAEISTTQATLESQQYPLEVRPSQFRPGGFLLLSRGVQAAVAEVSQALLGGSGLSATALEGRKVSKYSVQYSPQVLRATNGPIDRVNTVHSQLVEILNQRLPVTVSFKGRPYEDYHLLQVTLSERPGKFGSAELDVSLEKLDIVSGETVQLPDPADFKARPKKKVGNKSSKAKDDKKVQQGVGLTRRGVVSAGLIPNSGSDNLGALGAKIGF